MGTACRRFDELNIPKEIDDIATTVDHHLGDAGITEIRITSVPKRGDEAAADEDDAHDMLIKLTLHPKIFQPDLDEEDFDFLGLFIFTSKIAKHTGVMVEADCLDPRVK